MSIDKVVPIFFGKVTVDGKDIMFVPPEKVAAWERRKMAYAGCDVQLTLQKKRKKVSKQQRGYYFGALLPVLAEAAGMTDEEMHEALKWKFLRDSSREGILPVIKSFGELSTNETVEYIMSIKLFGSEFLGITEWPEPSNYDPITPIIHE